MNEKQNYRYLRLVSIIIMIMMLISTLAACSKGGGEEPVEEEEEEEEYIEPEIIMNPFTGDRNYTEEQYSRRPVAIVVENHPDARPQWSIDDPERSPDIIVQGEVEGGITRTLWLYADYRQLPEIIGPIRSARPPFIRFSEFFDSIFIHWGFSHSGGGYEGADKVFERDGVDHIDRMWYDNNVPLYDRADRPYIVNIEHTGIIYGDKVEDAIKDMKFRTERNKLTKFEFNESVQPVGEDTCKEITVDYSDAARGWMSMTWTYNEEDKKYHTDHFDCDVARDNLIILECTTEYKTNNYATYTRYIYSKGGTGYLVSQGTITKFKFSADMAEHLLSFFTEEELPAEENAEGAEGAEGENKEEEQAENAEATEGEGAEPAPTTVQIPVKLNPGKSWIGLISNNNGGMVHITPMEGTEEAAESGEGEASEDSEENAG